MNLSMPNIIYVNLFIIVHHSDTSSIYLYYMSSMWWTYKRYAIHQWPNIYPLLFNLIQINKSLWTMSAFLISFWKFNLTMSVHSRRKLFACIYSPSSFLYIFTAMSKLFKKIIFVFENKTLRLILVLVRLNTLEFSLAISLWF